MKWNNLGGNPKIVTTMPGYLSLETHLPFVCNMKYHKRDLRTIFDLADFLEGMLFTDR